MAKRVGVGVAVTVSAGVAALVGGAVAVLADPLVYPTARTAGIGFWSLLSGLAVAALLFAVLLGRLARPPAARVAARYLLALCLGLVALATTLWIAVWSVPLRTLEGAWLWPLALSTWVASSACARSARRRRR